MAIIVAALVVASACSAGSSSTTAASSTTASSGATPGAGGTTPRRATELPAGYAGFSSPQYADGQHWMCRPGNATEDVCDRDLTATVLRPDGTTTVEPHAKAAAPPIDCFYVYPTISNDPGLNSDLEPEADNEVWATVNQVARLNSTCRVFAPVYRQLTLGSLLRRQAGAEAGDDTAKARELAYGDVLAAWKHYLANDNQGRGVILVGHSQGAGVLKRLLVEEVDDEPLLRDRLVSAYLLGTSVGVPEGADVGGDLQNIPLCRTAGQVGCVITFASFPATAPPPDNSLFGSAGSGLVAGCTHPAALGGGAAPVTGYYPAAEGAKALGGDQAVTTPWVALAGQLTAECVVRNGRSVLEVSVTGNPSDPRVETLRRGLPASWGSHMADANLAMGDLERLAAAQGQAFAARG